MSVSWDADDANRRLEAAGIARRRASAWCEAVTRMAWHAPPAAQRLEPDAARARSLFEQGWQMLDAMPPRSQRDDAGKRAGETLVGAMADLCWRFCRAYRNAIYDRLSDRYSKALRVDELLWAAAELWPGLVPTRAQVAREAERKQMDKDGREIQQGMLVGQLLSDARIGAHLCASMLRPSARSRALLDEFVAKGALDLGAARLETAGETGYVYLHHPDFLNAEDDTTVEALETAVDLVLLHPALRIGVLRGAQVSHPKYRGRRIFSSGINLTRLYHGQVSYLFYLLRDMGLVNKLFRGLVVSAPVAGEPETTLEKPWLAVVDTFAIGGGCQLLLVVDYVIAEQGAYFNLPARKEGIIPGVANLRLPRFLGERLARQAILFDKTFAVDSPEAAAIVNEVHPRERLDAAVREAVANAVGSGMVSAAGNRKALRVGTEPLDTFRSYMATYAVEQAYCHLSDQLVRNLETHWNAGRRRL